MRVSTRHPLRAALVAAGVPLALAAAARPAAAQVYTHCYLLGRDAAETPVAIFSPVFPVDDALGQTIDKSDDENAVFYEFRDAVHARGTWGKPTVGGCWTGATEAENAARAARSRTYFAESSSTKRRIEEFAFRFGGGSAGDAPDAARAVSAHQFVATAFNAGVVSPMVRPETWTQKDASTYTVTSVCRAAVGYESDWFGRAGGYRHKGTLDWTTVKGVRSAGGEHAVVFVTVPFTQEAVSPSGLASETKPGLAIKVDDTSMRDRVVKAATFLMNHCNPRTKTTGEW